jgi:hypothetical protein
MITQDISGNCRARCRQITPKDVVAPPLGLPGLQPAGDLVEPHRKERPDQRKAEGQRDGQPLHVPQEQHNVDQVAAHHRDIGEEQAHHRLAPEIAQPHAQGIADIAHGHLLICGTFEGARCGPVASLMVPVLPRKGSGGAGDT